MAFSHPYGQSNAIASVNDWFESNITANGMPNWMPSARVVYDFGKENPLFDGHSGHAFSVNHFDVGVAAEFQGRNTVGGSAGQISEGMLEINCWINKRQAGEDFVSRLRTMGEMVSYLFISASDVLLNDYNINQNNPPFTSALVRLDPARRLVVGDDPNPDVRRQRFQANYRWVERV